MTRFKAAALHLLVSVGIGLISALVVYAVWYPNSLHAAVGVTSIFLMLLGIDIVLGPLLTLVVYKPSKKTLRFDLSMVASLQVAALIYGLYAVFIGRPAFEVFAKDRFEVVRAHEVEANHWRAAKPPFDRAPIFGPKRVAAVTPQDVTRRNEIMFSAIDGGPDLAQMPEFYVPLEQVVSEIKTKAQPIEQLKKLNAGHEADVDALPRRFAGQPIGFLPLKASARDMTVIVNTATGAVLDTVDLRPW